MEDPLNEEQKSDLEDDQHDDEVAKYHFDEGDPDEIDNDSPMEDCDSGEERFGSDIDHETG